MRNAACHYVIYVNHMTLGTFRRVLSNTQVLEFILKLLSNTSLVWWLSKYLLIFMI